MILTALQCFLHDWIACAVVGGGSSSFTVGLVYCTFYFCPFQRNKLLLKNPACSLASETLPRIEEGADLQRKQEEL